MQQHAAPRDRRATPLPSWGRQRRARACRRSRPRPAPGAGQRRQRPRYGAPRSRQSLAHPLGRPIRGPEVGPVGALDVSHLLFTGAGWSVRPERRRIERLQIAGGPPLHVVVSDTLAHSPHPATPFVLGGGDRAHDRLLDTLDVVRVADESLVPVSYTHLR